MDLVFPTSSSPGLRPQESAGRLINAYAEKAALGAPSDIIIRRSPGLQHVAKTGDYAHTRGFHDLTPAGNDALLWILNDRVLKVDSAFEITDLGELLGHDPVTTAKNNAVSPDCVVVTENGCFNLFDDGPPTAFADADLPANPTSVCDYDGYFIWSFASGHIYASNLNSVGVNALSFNIEQGLQVRRVVRYAGRLFAFGNKWTTVYRNAGTSPFPLAKEATIPKGIIGTHAIAGWEVGWANDLIWAADDFNVYKLQGYTPVPISTDDVSRDIERVVIAGLVHEIEAFVYMHGRNAFWVLSCPGEWTWEYNLSTGEWNERKSHEQDSWRGMASIYIFNQWVIGDAFDGSLYRLNGTYFWEGTRPLVWHVESGVNHSFPNRVVIPRISFHITAGIGNYTVPGISEPTVEISWALDGGNSWGRPVLRRLGGPGLTGVYPTIFQSGISRGQGIRYKLLVSDPVHVGLSGAKFEAENRMARG